MRRGSRSTSDDRGCARLNPVARARSAFVIATLAAVLSLQACKSTDVRAPGSVDTIELAVDGRTREYLVYAPRALEETTARHPLVVVLHGGGGNARQIMGETGPAFFRLAETHGFFVAFPNAVNKMWDFGDGKVSRELDERIDDRTYFNTLLSDVLTRLPVDADRVFATGISRGGQASYFLACEFPGRIRAIAPVAMPLPAFMRNRCQSGPPVGVAIMNGTDDPLVPYAGGEITVGRRERGEVLSTNATVALWQRRNGCRPDVVQNSRLDGRHDQSHVEVAEWRDCAGAPVVLYKIVGGGHTWPSGRQYLPRFVIGRVNTDIDGADVAWAFFSEFPQRDSH